LSFLAWAARRGVHPVLTRQTGLSVPKMSAPVRQSHVNVGAEMRAGEACWSLIIAAALLLPPAAWLAGSD